MESWVSAISEVKVVLFFKQELADHFCLVFLRMLLFQPQVKLFTAVFAECRGAEGISSNWLVKAAAINTPVCLLSYFISFVSADIILAGALVPSIADNI